MPARLLRGVAGRSSIRGGIDGRPAAQLPSTVSTRSGRSTGRWVLAAADPANPYGAALPWPSSRSRRRGRRPTGPQAGALVVLVDGKLVWFLERGGRRC